MVRFFPPHFAFSFPTKLTFPRFLAAITTEDGSLKITLTEEPWNGMNFRSGMLQSWNKVRFDFPSSPFDPQIDFLSPFRRCASPAVESSKSASRYRARTTLLDSGPERGQCSSSSPALPLSFSSR